MKKRSVEIEDVLDLAARVVANRPEWKRRVERLSEQEYLSRKKIENQLSQEQKTNK